MRQTRWFVQISLPVKQVFAVRCALLLVLLRGLPSIWVFCSTNAVCGDEFPVTLPRTAPLTIEKPVDEMMIDGLNRFCRRAITDAREQRFQHWVSAAKSIDRLPEEQELRRSRFRTLIGAVDPRLTVSPSANTSASDYHFEVVTQPSKSAFLVRNSRLTVYHVRWPVMKNITAEGLLFVPRRIRAAVVAIPDADMSPEMFASLSHTEDASSPAGIVQSLAESGCLTVVPLIMSRRDDFSGHADVKMTNQSHREFITRQAFEVGRHIIGYEVQKVLAAVDLLEQELECHPDEEILGRKPIGVVGVGEGGLLALYCAALDVRIQSCCICGYFQQREPVWQEPIYRNVWRLLTEFGDAELAALVIPRRLVIEACRVPEVTGPLPARNGRVAVAAPGTILTCDLSSVQAEYDRSLQYFESAGCGKQIVLAVSDRNPVAGQGGPGSVAAVDAFLAGLSAPRSDSESPIQRSPDGPAIAWVEIEHEQFDQLQQDIQGLISASHEIRRAIRNDVMSDGQGQTRANRLRDFVHTNLIGRLDEPLLPANPRSRLVLRTDDYVGYELVFDVYPDVIASGILLIPRISPGQKCPVVVCQHGLEGTPMDTIRRDSDSFRIYKAYAEQLVKQGVIVYCPQNPYRGGDEFRVLQRMSNPLGRTLFSYIIAQHKQTLDWLVTNPQVDAKRIAFYGISYGGKTAMRVPPFIGLYSAVICSGDFTDWPRTIASNSESCSYLFTGEYEIPEWNLANTASYAELAMLIAPRPFMVEAGRQDSGQPVSWVEDEFQKVREYYRHLGLEDQAILELFNGPHTIHGDGTIDFLGQHLKWKFQRKISGDGS